MTTPKIIPLEEHPAFAHQVAAWIEDEWRRLPIHEYFAAIATGEPWPSRLPRTLLAIDPTREQLLGTGSLLLDDMETRPDLNPWFGCLFVDPAFRNRGIGGLLVSACEDLARELGICHLYLFTAARPDLYARFGWSPVEKQFYEESWNTIMEKDVC